MDDIELRDFVDTDFGALSALWIATGLGDPARGDDLACLRRTLAAGARLLVLLSEGRLAGSCWLTDDARRLYLHHLAVLPELQGRGLGALLMERAVALAAEKGLQMKLEVHQGNARAIALYRRFGFDFIGDYGIMLRRRIG